MPKSKNKRKKVKFQTPKSDKPNTYTKTDGEGRICLYDKYHNFIKYINQNIY